MSRLPRLEQLAPPGPLVLAGGGGAEAGPSCGLWSPAVGSGAGLGSSPGKLLYPRGCVGRREPNGMGRAKAASHRASLCGSISSLASSVLFSSKEGEDCFPRCPPTLRRVTGCGSHSWVREDGQGPCARGFEQGGV